MVIFGKDRKKYENPMRDNDITLLFSVSSDDGLVVSGGFEPHQQRSGAGGVETLDESRS